MPLQFSCLMPKVIPKMGFPRGVLPPKVKTWEWSAVTTVSVSDSLVSCPARSMAASNITVSLRASLAVLSWWPWSILPRNKASIKEILFRCRPNWVTFFDFLRQDTHLPQIENSLLDSSWGFELPFLSFPQLMDHLRYFEKLQISCPLVQKDLQKQT